MFQKIFIASNREWLYKKRKLDRKFKRLVSAKRCTFHVDPLPPRNLVINKTDLNFNEKEIKLLELGVKYNPKDNRRDLEEMVVHIENGIRHLPDETTQQLRLSCAEQLKSSMRQARLQPHH